MFRAAAAELPAVVRTSAARRRLILGLSLRQHLGAVTILLATTLVFFAPLLRGETFLAVGAAQLRIYPWAGEANRSFTVGKPGDVPVAGDWNCDGRDEIGAWDGRSFRLPSSPSGPPVVVPFGAPGDIPLAGDWNGDGCDELAVRRGAAFRFRRSLGSGRELSLRVGTPTDTPLVGDWDGDGRDGIGIRRGRLFYLRDSLTPGVMRRAVGFGAPGQLAVAGDWDGDGRDEVGVRTRAGFRLMGFLPGGAIRRFVPFSFVPFGKPGDLPLVGDWNGDGSDDFGVRDGNFVSLLEVPAHALVHSDQVETFYPWQVFVNRAIRAGELPLWNPYSFAGVPFLANGQNGVLYPPRLVLSAILPPERVHDLLVSSHMFLGGLAMFLLLAYFRTSYQAALVGALAWMLNSFMLVWSALDHFVVIEALLPVALVLVDAAVRRRSWLASLALALVLALMYLGGNALFVELCFVTLALYALTAFLRDASRAGRAGSRARDVGLSAARLLAPGLLAAALVAVSLLPSLQLVASSGRASVTYQELKAFRLAPELLSNIFRAPARDSVDIYSELLFLGTATALLALVGSVRRHPLVSFMRWQAILVLLFVLGTPVTLVAYWVLPGFDSFKPLGRAAFAFAFPVAILAAFGFDTLTARLRRWSERWPRRAAIVLAALPVAIGLSIIVQMREVASEWMAHQPAGERYRYPETPLVAKLKREGDPRILATWPAFAGSSSMVFPLQNALGYESLVPTRTQSLWRVVQGENPRRLRRVRLVYAYHPLAGLARLRFDLLPRVGVTDLVTPPALAGDLERLAKRHRLKLVYFGRGGRVYRVPDPAPAAYLVAGCESVGSPIAALERFAAPSLDARRTVILERKYLSRHGLECREGRDSGGSPGTATIVRRRLNSLRVRVEALRKSWLVVSESWDPGWQATIDGSPAPVLPGNSAFRAIPVPAGAHLVSLRYSPSSYRLGKQVSVAAVGLSALLLAGTAARRRRKRRE